MEKNEVQNPKLKIEKLERILEHIKHLENTAPYNQIKKDLDYLKSKSPIPMSIIPDLTFAN